MCGTMFRHDVAAPIGKLADAMPDTNLNASRNKVAIVTGASRGIGRAIARRLASDGWRAALTARDAAALQAVVDQIREAGGDAASIALDLRAVDSAAAVVRFALERFGPVDVIANNAGATRRGAFLSLTDEDWADGFALKFFGAMRLTREAWPYLKRQSGSVVNIAGIGGRTPGPQFTIGGSVNAAMLSFTKALADIGLEDGVQVNAINPGSIRTDRLKLRLARIANEHSLDPVTAERQLVRESGSVGIGEPEDVANLVAYLISPAGRFIHGSLIDIDGGQTKTI
jgi:NAD(P)-dependent dehydrogenase (short-subunit alcohol dehydrogenase family)